MAEGMGVASGRFTAEDGPVYNLVDLLGAGAVPVAGLTVDIDTYSPRSGRIAAEDGQVYNVVDLIAAKQAAINGQIADAVDPLATKASLEAIADDVTELQNTGVDTVARTQLDELALAEDYGSIA